MDLEFFYYIRFFVFIPDLWNYRLMESQINKTHLINFGMQKHASRQRVLESLGVSHCLPHLQLLTQIQIYAHTCTHAWLQTQALAVFTQVQAHTPSTSPSARWCVFQSTVMRVPGCNRKSLSAVGRPILLFPLETPGQISICSSWSQRKLSKPLHIRTLISRECWHGRPVTVWCIH